MGRYGFADSPLEKDGIAGDDNTNRHGAVTRSNYFRVGLESDQHLVEGVKGSTREVVAGWVGVGAS